MKDRITSAKTAALATSHPLPVEIEYRGKSQYQASKRIADGKNIYQTFYLAKLIRR
ncbi:hypothetical protein [Acetobacter oryzifermentans]|uniref:hypothetical protein n=1 Tax=Acetobacter oryzifermentans TaxID=1633874 RepID=UPI000B14628A|nr:hypothetical protein [Acetobacter oryzifermentans]